MNSENNCSQLFEQEIIRSENPLKLIFDLQKQLQKDLHLKKGTINLDEATHLEKIKEISEQWRNMNMEMSELLDRLPWKNWKTYSKDELQGWTSDEQRLETWYEYVDILHFFVNIGLALGIDGEILERLYVTKNKENFDRQNRGY